MTFCHTRPGRVEHTVNSNPPSRHSCGGTVPGARGAPLSGHGGGGSVSRSLPTVYAARLMIVEAADMGAKCTPHGAPISASSPTADSVSISRRETG